MGVLAPLFAVGALLIAIPWFVHRIRRPERETVRFSSLMFVPDIKREVIERRRIQHVLLMLLRMLVLVALALAFARPFRDLLLNPEATEKASTDHVILMDTSLSMSSDGVLAQAQVKANEALAKVAPGDRVGFIRFDQSSAVDVPLSGDVSLVQRAIEGAKTTWAHTDYVSALQAVEQMLMADTARVQRIVHVISDFQVSGMPVSDTGWRLPGTIKVEAYPVAINQKANASIDALAVQNISQDALQIRARVRNWSGAGALSVQLVADGEVVETRDLQVLQGNATQVGFTLPLADGLDGYVGLASGDALKGDDRRFFSYREKPKLSIQVRDTKSTTYQLMSAAVPAGSDLPWQVVSTDDHLGAVIVADNLNSSEANELVGYVENGGALFLPLQENVDREGLNSLLGKAGMQVVQIESAGYAELTYVNLNHRIFHPFKGARFNDFSSVRYDSYHILDVDSSAVVLARFDDDVPAMVEGVLGQGRILVWAGGMDLGRTNLARTPRFVPLLHETLRYLAGEQKVKTDYVVGERVPLADNFEQVVGVSDQNVSDVSDKRVDAPGVYQWGEEGQKQSVAINVLDRESDLAHVTPAEFEIRLCDAPVLFRQAGERRASADLNVQYEYGHWVIGLLFVLLLVEHIYADFLRTRGEQA